MKNLKKESIKWLDQPEEHNYPSAQSYLGLLFEDDEANGYIAELRATPVIVKKAKDIFRASTLSLLGVSNSHVKRDQEKIESGAKLSPLLLVRDLNNRKVIIADGYHRLCAVYSYDEDAIIPCKMA